MNQDLIWRDRKKMCESVNANKNGDKVKCTPADQYHGAVPCGVNEEFL